MISDVLEGGALTARDISKAVSVREKEVIEHLPHVARSVGPGRRLVMEPSSCLECGFVFKKRRRFKTPGKCPVCRSEEITETRYGIVAD
jgi:predicted Zn-ribbon and HTH transcriptional regulator